MKLAVTAWMKPTIPAVKLPFLLVLVNDRNGIPKLSVQSVLYVTGTM
jgi:hypothetical protein